MSINYLLLLQNLREATAGIFDDFMLHISEAAESFVTFLFLAAIYWCVNKRTGQFIGMNVAFACTLNQFLKAVCKVERPWIRDERIQPVEKALAGAGGYSFPSGHTTRAAAVWGAAGYQAWKEKAWRGISAGCFGLTALVMLSRNYLGVHTFWDVLAALLIGAVIMLAADWLMKWTEAGQSRDVWVCITGCILLFLPMLRVGCLSNAGAGMGFFIGWLIERHFIRFGQDGSAAQKCARFCPGAILISGILFVLKPILALFMNVKYAGFFTGFVLMFFIMAVYPFLFSTFEKGKKMWAYLFVLVMLVIFLAAVWKVKLLNVQSENISEETVIPIETEAEEKLMQVIAHRGYSSEFPENTLSSFAGAIDIGADYIETDVQMTKDGILVLFHDNDVKRITGAEGAVSDYTYEELMQLDAGSWFHAAYAGEKIPTLMEGLTLIKDSNCRVYLELKDIGEKEGFTEAVLNTAEQCGMLERCVFASFQYQYLVQLKELNENVKTLYNTVSAKVTLPEEFPADYYGLYADTVRADTVRAIHEAGGTAFVWTADAPVQIKNLRAMDVDGIVTNKPGLAKVMVYPQYQYLADTFESSITMPGLYGPDVPKLCEDMVVQGLTQVQNTMVISAYSASGENNSVLYLMNSTGRLQQVVDLGFKAHTGGIAYDEQNDLLWVTGAEGNIHAISWTAVLSGEYQGEYQVSFNAGLLNHNGDHVASFLCLNEGELYVGSYVDGANGMLNRYDIRDVSTPKLLSSAAIPERIQGVAFQADMQTGVRYMYLTQGYQMEDAYLLKFVWEDAVTVYEDPLEKHVLPEGAEQITMTAKGLSILFESSARPYRETARVPNDQIYVIRTE